MQLSFALDEFVVFDLETTGLSPWGGDEIIEIGAMRIYGQEIDEKNFFHSLVNPKRFIPEDSTRVNGITNDMVKEAPPVEDVLPHFLEFLGGAKLVAQNAKFDMSFLMKHFLQMNLKKEIEVHDTIAYSKRAFPDAPRHNLDAIANRLGLSIGSGTRHRSLGDVHLTARAFLILKDRLGAGTPQPEKWSC